MTEGRRLELAWSEHQGRSCLRIGGWTDAEFRALGGLAAGEIVRRLAFVPTEFIEAGGDLHAGQTMAGQFEVEEDTVFFIPRFPFMDGIGYSLLVDSSPGVGDELTNSE